MKAWSKQFALVFFAGLIALAVALGYGSMSGSLLSPNPFLLALRFLGAGLMANGLTLWIILLREDAGKPGLDPFLGLMLLAGILVLVLRLLYPSSDWTQFFDWGGLGLAVGALIIAVIAMIVSPAYPKPMTGRWPEGGEPTESQHSPTQPH